jgi:phage terminase large subunit
MILEFDSCGNEKQKLAASYWADTETMEIVYGGSKGSGKSYLGCSMVFGDALIYPETFYFIARKQLNDLRKYTIPSIHEVFVNFGISDKYYSYNGQDNYFSLYNKSRVYLLDAKYLPSDPLYARFGSMQMTKGWIEEGGEFEAAAKNNLLASVGRWKNDIYNLKGKVLITCNPMKNFLFTDFYLPSKKGELAGYKKFVQALPQDNKRLPKGYIENLHLILSRNEKERLLFGNWEYDDDPTVLIQYENIINCFSNNFVQSGNKFITSDIARYGRDKTVIGVWDGWRLVKIVTIDKSGLDYVADEIRKIATAYHVPLSNIIVDEDGVGGGVKDFLKCKGFVNNSVPIATPSQVANFTNLKSQCYFGLADKVNKNEVFFAFDGIDKEKTIEELQYVKQAKFDSDGKKSVLRKEDVKELLGRSPDYSDMIMMRYWFDLKNTTAQNLIRLF